MLSTSPLHYCGRSHVQLRALRAWPYWWEEVVNQGSMLPYWKNRLLVSTHLKFSLSFNCLSSLSLFPFFFFLSFLLSILLSFHLSFSWYFSLPFFLLLSPLFSIFIFLLSLILPLFSLSHFLSTNFSFRFSSYYSFMLNISFLSFSYYLL